MLGLESDEVPEVEVRRRRGISIAWLIPLVAGAIAIWLGYPRSVTRAPTTTIAFDTAEGGSRPARPRSSTRTSRSGWSRTSR